MSPAVPVFVTGFFTAFTLIAAIGAQNAFVLRQGIRGEHVLPVVLLCIGSDAALIVAGVAGFGALVSAHSGIVTVAKVGGAAFLIGYGALAARRAWRPAGLTAADVGPMRLTTALLTCAALTFLNPHVYLDTVILLGALASDHDRMRWVFGIGATTASAVWFTGLGFGARKLAGVFASPGTWRVLDGIIAVTMFSLAIVLLLG